MVSKRDNEMQNTKEIIILSTTLQELNKNCHDRFKSKSNNLGQDLYNYQKLIHNEIERCLGTLENTKKSLPQDLLVYYKKEFSWHIIEYSILLFLARDQIKTLLSNQSVLDPIKLALLLYQLIEKASLSQNILPNNSFTTHLERSTKKWRILLNCLSELETYDDLEAQEYRFKFTDVISNYINNANEIEIIDSATVQQTESINEEMMFWLILISPEILLNLTPGQDLNAASTNAITSPIIKEKIESLFCFLSQRNQRLEKEIEDKLDNLEKNVNILSDLIKKIYSFTNYAKKWLMNFMQNPVTRPIAFMAKPKILPPEFLSTRSVVDNSLEMSVKTQVNLRQLLQNCLEERVYWKELSLVLFDQTIGLYKCEEKFNKQSKKTEEIRSNLLNWDNWQNKMLEYQEKISILEYLSGWLIHQEIPKGSLRQAVDLYLGTNELGGQRVADKEQSNKELMHELETTLLIRQLRRSIVIIHTDNTIVHHKLKSYDDPEPIFVFFNKNGFFDALVRDPTNPRTGKEILEKINQFHNPQLIAPSTIELASQIGGLNAGT